MRTHGGPWKQEAQHSREGLTPGQEKLSMGRRQST